jgi:8-oxo-dGTP pyrophosphatase MutT (NUDIX family)
MKPWVCRKKEPVISAAPWLEVERHEVELPDGTAIGDWMWVKVPDFVNVAAVDGQGNFHVFRQQKYAVPGITFGVVGGYVDEGETPLQAAVRELEEEMGLQSDQVTSLGTYAMDGNRGCGSGHLFLAEACTQTGTPVADDLEDQERMVLTPDELKQALLQGKFGVASWTATLALALLSLET